MFDQEWIEYFKVHDPFIYYCIVFLQFMNIFISYFFYACLLLIVATPIYMIYSGTKMIKIKLVENKKHKKFNKEKKRKEEFSQKMYLDHLDKSLKKKKKHK